MASAGCIGKSGAITSAPGSISRNRVTVPDRPEEPKPWTYIIFRPAIRSGYVLK